MIGYIVAIHYHYDGAVPASNPCVVYLSRDAAQAEADKHNATQVSGEVWEVALPDPASIPSDEGVPDGWTVATEPGGQTFLSPDDRAQLVECSKGPQ